MLAKGCSPYKSHWRAVRVPIMTCKRGSVSSYIPGLHKGQTHDTGSESSPKSSESDLAVLQSRSGSERSGRRVEKESVRWSRQWERGHQPWRGR